MKKNAGAMRQASKWRAQDAPAILKRAVTFATSKYTIGGQIKKNPPRPITLPKLKSLT